MKPGLSLRMRLTLIILLPLLALSVLVGFWELRNAQATAKDIFDKSLLSAALAVSNDVAVSDGDALSPRTVRLLSDTSGGRVFYHVFGPDGVIVAGYARPPVGIPTVISEIGTPTYFEASYLSQDVSGVRLRSQTEIDGFTGIFTTTVWQPNAVRQVFVRDQVARTFVVITSLTLSAALIVWFGIQYGLRPLDALEDAIAQRSSDELSPIRRAVPIEVKGIVQRLNGLLGQVSASMTRQSEFISDAAHQLRNPIAGLLSMAEAVHASPSEGVRKQRSEDLLIAAKQASELTEKLLMLERAKSLVPESSFQRIDLPTALPAWLAAHQHERLVEWSLPDHPVQCRCDPDLLREAILNLIDNSVRHGGDGLTVIKVGLRVRGAKIEVSISDDGVGIPPALVPRAKERFRQISQTSNSGLGLSFAEAVAKGHGGAMDVETLDPGLKVTLALPHPV